jgi:hypothetical protein
MLDRHGANQADKTSNSTRLLPASTSRFLHRAVRRIVPFSLIPDLSNAAAADMRTLV